VRVCQAAREHRLDIAGSLFRMGGEPFTEGKAQVVRESGSRALAHYGMTEVGRIGLPCAAPQALDDVHLTSDRLAVLQRERPAANGLGRVGAFHFTTLHPRTPKLMLNVESGDYGMIADRDCGCAIGQAGLSRHLHSIRSYEKLTSEGMLFFGDELVSILEQTLPSRFGGGPADYQLVEQEVDGLPRIHLVISPRVGGVVESEVVACLLQTLGDGGRPSRNMMADIWIQAGSVRVERREPYLTPSAKVLPLHILNRAAPDGAPRKEP
jgi:phenylacetate-coenzyme A ligase PaaK-like adenylate-forming protein